MWYFPGACEKCHLGTVNWGWGTGFESAAHHTESSLYDFVTICEQGKVPVPLGRVLNHSMYCAEPSAELGCALPPPTPWPITLLLLDSMSSRMYTDGACQTRMWFLALLPLLYDHMSQLMCSYSVLVKIKTKTKKKKLKMDVGG